MLGKLNFFIALVTYLLFTLKAKSEFPIERKSKLVVYLLAITILSCNAIVIICLYNKIDSGYEFNSIASIVCYFISIIYFNWALRSRSSKLTAIFSDNQPQFLLTEGAYKYSRHPFYFSYLLSYFAGLLGYPSLITLFIYVLMNVIYYTGIFYEEKKFLNSQIKDQYENYKSKTNRVWPFILWTKK